MVNEKKFKELKETLKQLKDNPLFQLSLGSKELFHSNFLAYILSDNEYAKTFVNQLDGFQGEEILKVTPPNREKDNIDLCFRVHCRDYFRDVIIENKVKKVPHIEQLNEYFSKRIQEFKKEEKKLERKRRKKPNENIKRPLFVLLTLISPPNNVTENIGDWKVLTYSGLAEKLEETEKEYLEEHPENFLSNIRNSYISFIKKLAQLKENLKTIPKEQFKWQEESDIFKKVRLHDLFQKVKFEGLYDILVNKISNDKELKDSIQFEYQWNSLDKNWTDTYYMKSDYSNSSGGFIDFKHFLYRTKIDSKVVHVALTMQIQSRCIQYGVEVIGKQLAEKTKTKCFPIAYAIHDNNLWLGKQNIGEMDMFFKNRARSEGRKYKDINPKHYNSFSGQLAYKNDEFNTVEGLVINVDELSDLFIKMIRHIQYSKEDILELIKLRLTK